MNAGKDGAEVVQMSRSVTRCSLCGCEAEGTPENEGYSDCCNKRIAYPPSPRTAFSSAYTDPGYEPAFQQRKADLKARGIVVKETK